MAKIIEPIENKLAPMGDGRVWCKAHPTVFYDPEKHRQCFRCYLKIKRQREEELREYDNSFEK